MGGKTSRPAPRVSTLVPFIIPGNGATGGIILWSKKESLGPPTAKSGSELHQSGRICIHNRESDPKRVLL